MRNFWYILFLCCGGFVSTELDASECPLCHNNDIRPIVYGCVKNQETLSKAQRGELILGGCCVSKDHANYRCLFCWQELVPLMSEISDAIQDYQEKNKLSDDFKCSHKPMKSEDIALPDMIYHGEPLDFQFYLAPSYIELHLQMGWAYMEVPLASMYGVFPPDTEKYLSSAKEHSISLYFLTTDARKYQKMADYVLLMLYPQMYFKTLPSFGEYRLLGQSSPKSVFTLYEALKASPELCGNSKENEYRTRLIARLEDSLSVKFRDILVKKLKETKLANTIPEFESREKSGLPLRWRFKDLNIEFSFDKAGISSGIPFGKEFPLGKMYSVYFFYSDAEAWNKYKDLWTEICQELSRQYFCGGLDFLYKS